MHLKDEEIIIENRGMYYCLDLSPMCEQKFFNAIIKVRFSNAEDPYRKKNLIGPRTIIVFFFYKPLALRARAFILVHDLMKIILVEEFISFLCL